MKDLLFARTTVFVIIVAFLMLTLIPCEECSAGEFFLFKIGKKAVRGVGKVFEKTANGLGGVARGVMRISRKIDHGRKKLTRFTQRIIPKPLRRITNPIIAKTIDKGFMVISPHVAMAAKTAKKIEKVNQLKKARQEARGLAKDMRQWGNDIKEKTKDSILILRQNKMVSPRQEIKILEKANRVKIEIDKAADKVERAAGKITLSNILGTVADAGGVVGGKSGDILKKISRPAVKAVLTGTIKNIKPLDIAKRRLGDEIVKIATYKVYNDMPVSKQKKIQSLFRIRNSKIKIKITPQGLKDLIERGKVTKIVNDSIKKGKGLKIDNPSDVDDILKDILKGTVKDAYKKAIKEAPKTMVKDILMNALIRKYPDKKDEIKDVFKNLPDIDEIKQKVSKTKKNIEGKIPPKIISDSDMGRRGNNGENMLDIVSKSELDVPTLQEEAAEIREEDKEQSGTISIIEIMADTEPVVYEDKGYSRLINIEGIVIKGETPGGEIKLISGNEALAILLSYGYFVKFQPLGYVSSSKYDEDYYPDKPIIQEKPEEDPEEQSEDDDFSLKGIMGDLVPNPYIK